MVTITYLKKFYLKNFLNDILEIIYLFSRSTNLGPIKNDMSISEAEIKMIEQFSDNIKFFNKQVEVIIFPSWDCLPYSNISPRKEIISRRYGALRASNSKCETCKIVLLSLDSILQKTVPAKEILSKQSLTSAFASIASNICLSVKGILRIGAVQ